MHPTRIAEQASTMLSLGNEQRQKTLMGCQFDRIPKDSTQHYSQWANSLSNERLYLEQFRECTLVSDFNDSDTDIYIIWDYSLLPILILDDYNEFILQLQPTWFLSKTWFERLGGYLEAPASDMDETNWSKRARIDRSLALFMTIHLQLTQMEEVNSFIDCFTHPEFLIQQ